MALMKLAFALAGFLFNFYLMRYAKDYSHWIYTGIGLLFLLGFCILCLMVKEGQYPEPEVLTKSNDPMLVRALSWLKGYFKDSFGILFFTMLFLGTALHQVSTACRSIFNLLFATKDLGLTEGQFGQIMGIGSLISLAVIFICGMLMNKLKAIRIYIGSGYLIIALNIFGYFFVKDYITFYIVGVLIVIIYSIQNLCNVPMFADLFPKNKFGQFSSANAMINSLLMIVANFGGGLAIDYFGYRFIFIWDTIFTSLATIILLYVYFKWRRNNYSTDRIIQKAVSDSAKIHSVELIDAID
jgi:MFS family permease